MACHLGSPIFSVTVRWTWEPDADTVIVREAINGYWDLNHVVTDRTVTEYRFYNLWHQNPHADDQAKIDGEVDQYSGGSAGTLLRADATQPPSTMIPVPDCSATQPS